ncbi:MAG: hypothetical protein IPJ87_03270 [Flavobacteriales bacterium]|nr:hypothetical protein [Flavobacteriales bacterium]MBK7940886.1 hypothetical protein [Flavobacteriales bacterium]MBK9701691.1 hypothetical protein [Flavobacteriales bacterium]
MAQLLILVDLIGVLLIEIFLLTDIKITQDVPATVMPGSETKVTLTVEKGDLSGFAKLQIDLPEGFTCTAIETKGASFTFSDQKAKFIWMSLPTQPSFKVSYNLVASASASGQMPINGRFSYILDNERRIYDLATAMVTVMGDPAVAAATPAAAPITQPTDASNDIVTAAGAVPMPSEEAPAVPSTPGQGPGGVAVERKVTLVSASELLVEVMVKKGDIRGFGKLQENLPPGFTAMEKSSAQAIFTTQDRIAKFVWLNLPADQELKVAYKLRANGQPDGDYTVSGEFGYLLNDETQRVAVGASTFTIGDMAFSALHQDQARMSPTDAQDTSLNLPAKETRTETAQAVPSEDSKPATTRPAPSKGVPAPEKGIAYKVQITAAHREVGREYFAGRHRFNEPFSIERHDGWIKYTTGSYGQYREARDKRIALVAAGHELPGPFVTAYNNGERISVQEALMLSSQTWVQ